MKGTISKADAIHYLSSNDPKTMEDLLKAAREVKSKFRGDVVYYRGLIEFSNICAKNCYYCGLRCENHNINRYQMTEDEILAAVDFAYQNKYASIVLQSGENKSENFVRFVEKVLEKIYSRYEKQIGITLSCGEQTTETYQRWLKAGAHRYLLRIESSSRSIYNKIHPLDGHHDYDQRRLALQRLKELGYQVGSGFMVGLPFQRIEDIADDIFFMQEIDVDMIGLGPYIDHSETPLYDERNHLLPLEKRFELALKSVALLRILLKDINIAAATALQVIDPAGREKAILSGANIVMPNITPVKYRKDYVLYEKKPCMDDSPLKCFTCMERRILGTGNTIGYSQFGDSPHFKKNSK